jgi:mono/diheme cytochrome c family protein
LMQAYSRHMVWAGIAGFAAVLVASATLMGEGQKTAKDGVFSSAQADRGEAAYKDQCASCHSDDLTGGSGPALAGDDFLGNWDKAPVLELVTKIQNTMPWNAPGSLKKAQSIDITAFILKVNKFPAGTEDLPADDDGEKAITIVR